MPKHLPDAEHHYGADKLPLVFQPLTHEPADGNLDLAILTATIGLALLVALYVIAAAAAGRLS